MRIAFDPTKRARTLVERGLDFVRAKEVFAGRHLTARDLRHAQEERWITAGSLDNRLVVLVWTRRGRARRVISMRKANAREQARYASRLG